MAFKNYEFKVSIRQLTLLYILIIAIVVEQISCIRFDLQPNSKKCLKEEMRKDLLAVGEFEVSNLPGSKVDFQVTDSKGHTAMLRENIDGKGKFAVTSDEDDIYDFCFTYHLAFANVASPCKVDFDVRLGVEAKQYDTTSTDKLERLETDLTKLEDLTNSIIEDFAHLKKRESEMQDTNESTEKGVLLQTIVSVLLVFGLAGFQIMYLRIFFIKKKIIR